MQPAKASSQHTIKRIIYLLTGSIGGLALGLMQYYDMSASRIPAWTGLFGVMLVLAFQNVSKLPRLAALSLLSSGFIIECWANMNNTSTDSSLFILLVFFTYSINAFNIAYQQSGFPFVYTELFHAVWDTILKLFIAIVFTIFSYLLLYLAATVFSLVHLTLITQILKSSIFITGSLYFFAICGLYIADLSSNIIKQLRLILLNSCKVFLPALSIILIIYYVGFILSLISSKKPDFSFTMYQSICLLGVIFINGVFQTGSIERPYTSKIRLLVNSFIHLLVPTALLGLYTFLTETSVNKPGINSFILISLMLLYALSYSIVLIKNEKIWMNSIKKVNIYLAYCLIAIVLLTNNYFISVHDKNF